MEDCIESISTEGDIETTIFTKDEKIIAKRIIAKSHWGPIEKWYSDDKLHRDGQPAEIQYSDNGRRHEYWYQYGKKHRDGGPAVIYYNSCGTKESEEWYQNSNRHRDGQPAVIRYDWNGNKKGENWYQYDEEYMPEKPEVEKQLAIIEGQLAALMAIVTNIRGQLAAEYCCQ